MITQQIPTNEWAGFFENFSRKHEGALVSLQVISLDIGAQVEQRELALQGLSHELDGSARSTVIIMMGSRPDQHVTHSITRPTEVNVEKTDEGTDIAISIKDADGNTALLQLLVAIQPAVADAVLP